MTIYDLLTAYYVQRTVLGVLHIQILKDRYFVVIWQERKLRLKEVSKVA